MMWCVTPLPELLTTQEVAELLRVDPSTVHRWATSGKLRSIVLPGGQRRFDRADLNALIGAA